jgi:ankyrin repeat protein
VETRYLVFSSTLTTTHYISHLRLDSVTMPPPKFPLEILLMIAHLLTDDEGKLCFADFNSFLKVNRALYSCLNRTLWQEAVEFESITARVFTHLIRINDLAHFRSFLELGADVETVLLGFVDHEIEDWGSKKTLLMVAVRLDNVPMARLLLEHGADLVHHNGRGLPNYSAIHAARSAKMVQLLLDHHADPEQQTGSLGLRPLHFYARRDNIEAMRAILRNGGEVDPNTWRPWATPLYYAAQRNIDAVKLLLEHGADVKKRGWAHATLLHSAAHAGKTDVVRLLVESWPEGLREKNIDGNTPLHFAARKGRTDVVRLLAEIWPEGLREKNNDGNTPLHLAARKGRTDVVRLLVEVSLRARGRRIMSVVRHWLC